MCSGFRERRDYPQVELEMPKILAYQIQRSRIACPITYDEGPKPAAENSP